MMNFTRLHILVGLMILFGWYGCTNKHHQVAHPNIIYILADDLGYGDVSCFNPHSKIATPNIDGLARDGMKFTDAHTSSSVCTPTRYGILTGRYNWRSPLKKGVLYGMSDALIPTTRTTVAAMLKNSGYRTAFIGKWHLGWQWTLKEGTTNRSPNFNDIDYTRPIGHAPNDLGFEYAYGHPASLDMPPYVYVENKMTTQPPDTTTVNTGEYSWWREGPTGTDFVHEEVTPHFFKKSMDYIRQRAEEDDPFFLYLPLPSPHTPILPVGKWKGASNLNPYGDFVMMIDDYIGRLMQVLEETGIEENTLIIFTSDNGCSPEANFELLESKGHYPSHQFRGHKADIYEGGHRVPFIARWPAKIEKGSICDATICTTDFFATCADIVNCSIPDTEGEDSFSMMALLTRNSSQSSRKATIHHSINGSFAIRKGKWKLIMCPGSGGWSFPRPDNEAAMDTLPRLQLYNLEKDPKEEQNVYANYPDTVSVLKDLLIEDIQKGRSTPGAPQSNDDAFEEWPQINFVNDDE